MSIEGEKSYRPEWIRSGTGDEIPYHPTTNQDDPEDRPLLIREYLGAFLPPRETEE